MGGNRFGKECWGVFVCVMSQGQEPVRSPNLCPLCGGSSHPLEGVEGHQLSLESLVIASYQVSWHLCTGPLFYRQRSPMGREWMLPTFPPVLQSLLTCWPGSGA